MAARQTQPRPSPGSVLVPLKPIPRFRVLSAIERNLEREASELLELVRQNVMEILKNAPLDPSDEVLLARSAGLQDGALGGKPAAHELRKNLFKLAQEEPEAARGLALATHELRAEYGAPLRAGGILPEPVIDRVLAQLPFRSGIFRTERARALVPKMKDAQFTRGVMPLVDVICYAEDVRATRLKRSLTGERTSVPRVIRHEDGQRPEWTVLSGVAEVVAALVLQLPALDVEILSGEVEPAPIPREPGQDLTSALRIAASAAAGWTYQIPPALEPVAQLARQMAQRQFLDAFGARSSEEEATARAAADTAELNRTRAWLAVYQVARAAGGAEEVSRLRADRSPDVRRIMSAARGLARIAARKESEAHDFRERMRLAKAEAHQVSRELDLPLWTDDVYEPWSLWHQARRAPEGDLVPDEDVDEIGEVAEMEDRGPGPYQVVLESRRLRGTDGAPALMMPIDSEPCSGPPEYVVDSSEGDRDVPEVATDATEEGGGMPDGGYPELSVPEPTT